MTKSIEPIPIFFSIDDNYAPFLSVSLCSMIQNASKDHTYRIIILYQDLSCENRQKLSAFAGNNFDLQFVPMGNRLDGIRDRMGNRLRADYFTLTIYFRLFIPVMFPEYEKALYLDSDTVVTGDISELYHTELNDNYIGAVADHSIAHVPPLVKYVQYAVGVPKQQYINSGVLLMNLEQLRRVRFERRFLELMNTYHFDCIAPDQDYLNAMCRGKIHYLPHCWNTMPAAGKEPPAEPKLIHYNLFSKPWHYDSIQYQEYFWNYARRSPFYPQILKTKRLYSEQERQSDHKHLELLLLRGEAIADSKINFRTVFNGRSEQYL